MSPSPPRIQVLALEIAWIREVRGLRWPRTAQRHLQYPCRPLLEAARQDGSIFDGCIGSGFAMMEARLILATMAQRYRLSLEADDPIKPIQLVTVRPSRSVRMRAEGRG